MKLLRLVAAAVLAVSAVSVVHAAEMKQFLLENYGWTINLGKQEKKFFGFSWNLDCSPKQALPQTGVNIFRYTACIQRDKTFWTTVYWRLQSVKPGAVEKMVYQAMSDGLGYGKVICSQEVAPSAVNPAGVIKDCTVPLQQGTFYVSFYHFSVPMPAGGSFVNNDGKKEENLDFSIWVQNAGNSDPAVKEKIRELVSAIQAEKK